MWILLDLVGKQIGNYVAKSVLGRGGMGIVYLAEHPLIGRKVAVKVLHEELAINEQMVHRLWLEAKSASEIDSDHIVEVLDFGRLHLGTAAGDTRETVYLAMELLSGQSLADRFWEQGMSFREAVDVARQICRALAASHDKGIVHRDLKPENVHLIERGGRRNFVKILDFGIAKLVSNPYTRTRTGVLLGTPAYMSPEQCRGSGEVDHRSDIYSLGVMLYELTSGTVPFAAAGFGDVLVAHMTRVPEPPSSHNPGLPKSLEAIIMCALQKRPDDRFQSMSAFGAALEQVAVELDRMAEAANVHAAARAEKTTERDAGDQAQGATLVDPPEADAVVLPAPVVAAPAGARDMNAVATQLLDPDRMHHRATQLLGDVHAHTTMLKNPAGSPAPTSAPTARPTVTPPPGSLPKPALNQRLGGVSLREVLGSTGAVRQLEDALDEKGAPRPLAPDLTPLMGHPISEEQEFVAREQRRRTRAIVIVAGVVLVAMVALLFALR